MNKFAELVIEILQEEVSKNEPLFEKRFIDANYNEAEIEMYFGKGSCTSSLKVTFDREEFVKRMADKNYTVHVEK